MAELVACGKCGELTVPIVCEWREAVCPKCWKEMTGS